MKSCKKMIVDAAKGLLLSEGSNIYARSVEIAECIDNYAEGIDDGPYKFKVCDAEIVDGALEIAISFMYLEDTSSYKHSFFNIIEKCDSVKMINNMSSRDGEIIMILTIK